jgi:ribonuclease E
MDGPLGAAFVQFDGTEIGMLPLAGRARLPEGASIVVQVLNDRRGAKSARLTRAITLAGRHLRLRVDRPGIEIDPQMESSPALEAARKALAARLPPGHGLILRTAVEPATLADLETELDRLLELWLQVAASAAAGRSPLMIRSADDPLEDLLRDIAGPRETSILCADRTTARLVQSRITERGLGDFPVHVMPTGQWTPSPDELAEALDAAMEKEVSVPGGGSLLVEPGQTLTAIDVNAGDSVGRGAVSRDPERARFELNRAAAWEIARQLRLRNLGGLIVIDFIGLRRPADRRAVVDELHRACCADPQPCQILEMSRFGLVEMMRQSVGATLAEQLASGP